MVLDIFRLDNRVAWVTGGTKGLGLAMAHALAGAGANVVVNSRNEGDAMAAAEAIAAASGRRAAGWKADVTQAEEVAELVRRVEGEFGAVDILVNNAGINIRKPTTEIPLEEWQQVIDINLSGPFICTRAVIPQMVERHWGRIVHVASILGQVGMAGRPAYTASKGGLVLLTRTQALELAGTGVTVNALCPGPFETAMNLAVMNDPAKYQSFVSRIPMGRWGKPEELAGAVIFLTSNASSFVTGTTLFVDGGWTAQ